MDGSDELRLLMAWNWSLPQSLMVETGDHHHHHDVAKKWWLSRRDFSETRAAEVPVGACQ